jgi:hypothetical protein
MEGGRSAWVNGKILSNPAVVWIGLISYPLYLFHWPALSFVHIVKGEKVAESYIWGALLLTLILTVPTYYLIEKPIRFSKSKRTVPILLFTFVGIGLLAALVSVGWLNGKRSPRVVKYIEVCGDNNWGKGFAGLWYKGSVIMNKVGGDGPRTLFFGDSNAQQYGPRIQKQLQANTGQSRGAVFLTCGGAPPVPNITGEQRYQCEDLIAKYREVIASDSKIDRVVIAALWSRYFAPDSIYLWKGRMLSNSVGREGAIHELGLMIKELTAKGKKVTLVLNVPAGPELDPSEVFQRTFLGWSEKGKLSTMTARQFLDSYGDILKSIAETARANGAEVIDPMEAACLVKDGICVSENDNGPIRYNSAHLRCGFVKDHVTYLDQTVKP